MVGERPNEPVQIGDIGGPRAIDSKYRTAGR